MERELIKKAERLGKLKRMTILRFLQNMNAKISECNDGTRVNLDKLNTPQKKKLKQLVEDLARVDPVHQI